MVTRGHARDEGRSERPHLLRAAGGTAAVFALAACLSSCGFPPEQGAAPGDGAEAAEPVTAPAPWLGSSASALYRAFDGGGVRWYPWGEAAFAQSKELDRPIFVLLAYPACPWTARMRRETFDDPTVAGLINRDTVPVLVDTEARPDLAELYQRYAVVANGKASWPLCIWLTPDRLPLSSSNYLPGRSGGDPPGLAGVLEHVYGLWEKFPDHYRDQSRRDAARFIASATPRDGAADWEPSADAIEPVLSGLAAAFDPVHGGFTGRPKFLFPPKLFFLLDYAGFTPRERGRDRAAEMVADTLDGFRRSAMVDPIGGGVFRYSEDSSWNVPNFEKLLPDQALAARLFLRHYQERGDPSARHTAERILAYTEQRLGAPGGGYFSSESAESPVASASASAGDPSESEPDGIAPTHAVGAYYTWSADEVAAALAGEPDGTTELVSRVLGIKPGGNVPVGAIPGTWETTGKNLPRLETDPTTADDDELGLRLTPEEAEAALSRGLALLTETRARRPAPAVDEKLVLAWNAYYAETLVLAAEVLEAPGHLDEARRLLAFLTTAFTRTNNDSDTTTAETLGSDPAPAPSHNRGPLVRVRHGNGNANAPPDSGTGPEPAHLSDYAALTSALLAFHDATGEAEFLEAARKVHDAGDALFYDEPAGGYFSTRRGNNELFHSFKIVLDGAEPSPYALATTNLIRLAELTGDATYEDRARRSLAAASSQLRAAPAECGTLGSALIRLLQQSPRDE